MDLLYSRYSNPHEFMNTYIEYGRFGEFVSEILEMEFNRKREKAEKENEDRLWTAYVHSYSEKSFIDWKNDLMIGTRTKEKADHTSDADMTESEIIGIIDNLFSKGE